MDFLQNLKIKATGIGSMPHKDAKFICRYILDKFPDLPFWPQLPKINAKENMLIQYSENLPCLLADLQRKGVYVDASREREEELLKFYERFTENDLAYFKMSPEYAAGFYQMLSEARSGKSLYFKGQVAGPLTFLASVYDLEGKALLYDEILSDAVVKALAMKAVWQAKQIQGINKSPVIFLDEPYLAGFGSAFCNLSREKVVATLNETIRVIKNHIDIPVGIHCCGNTDWGMMLETELDIISFDFFGFGKKFNLYPEAIKRFISRGGIIAWGIIPTSEDSHAYSRQIIMEKFRNSLLELDKKGIDRNSIIKNSLFTPACGLGLLEERIAQEIIELTAEFSEESFQAE